MRSTRSSVVGLPCIARTTSLAASTCWTSFISCRACRGVLLRSRRNKRSRDWEHQIAHERRWSRSRQGIQAASIDVVPRPKVVTGIAVGISNWLPNIRRLVGQSRDPHPRAGVHGGQGQVAICSASNRCFGPRDNSRFSGSRLRFC